MKSMRVSRMFSAAFNVSFKRADRPFAGQRRNAKDCPKAAMP
jgi:hypothetical protein